MKYTRDYVERRSRMNCHYTDVNEEWYMATVLGAIQMYCRKDDKSVTPHLIGEGFWEAWITAWVLNNVDEETWFIDIGANTGYYSHIARWAGAHVMAYEPNPKYAELIRATVKIGWDYSRESLLPDNHFNVFPYALSDSVGTAVLTVPNELQGSASIRDGLDGAKYPSDHIKVATTTLDQQLAGIPKKNMVIKIDAEGAEELIWNGMTNVLVRQKPVVILEYTPGSYSDEFIDKLERYAPLAWINHAGDTEPVTREWLLSQRDWVMLVLRPSTQ